MRAAFLLAMVALGCAAEVAEPEPTLARWTLAEPGELEENLWDPQHPSCVPSAEALADWDADIERDLVGRFRVEDELPGARLELSVDGHYEWRLSGCVGTTFEVGIVAKFDDWVVLQSDSCRWRFPSASSGAFVLRELDGVRILVPADEVARFDSDPEATSGVFRQPDD